MEVGETVESLDILNTKLDLTVRKVFVVLKVSKRNFNDTSLEFFRGNSLSGSLGDDSFSKVFVGEHGWCLKLVPFLLEERVDAVMYMYGKRGERKVR
jgi:hypothetical protein